MIMIRHYTAKIMDRDLPKASIVTSESLDDLLDNLHILVGDYAYVIADFEGPLTGKHVEILTVYRNDNQRLVLDWNLNNMKRNGLHFEQFNGA